MARARIRAVVCNILAILLFLWMCKDAAFLLWNKPNIHLLDLIGHIASGHFLRRDGLHMFNMTRLGGIINNLFYPPREDVVVGTLLHLLTYIGLTPLEVVPYYTVGVYTLYIGSILLIASRFKHSLSIRIFLAYVYLFLAMSKSNLMSLQGLGILDIAFTGLTSQIRGGVFLNILLRVWLGKQQLSRLTILITLMMLSHLLIGPLGFLIVGCGRLLQMRSWKYLGVIGLALGMSSLFRLPFISYRDYAVSALIHLPPSFELPLLAIVLLVVVFHEKKVLPILLTSLIVLVPVYLQYADVLFDRSITLPNFHYYRLESLAFYLLLVAGGYTLDIVLEKGAKKYVVAIASVLFFVLLFLRFSPQGLSELAEKIDPKDMTVNVEALESLEEGSKLFVIDKDRPIDFNIASIIPLYTDRFQFVRGLYFESSQANQLISSYLATLLAPQDIVLDYFHYYGLNCPAYETFMNNFIRTYAIRAFLVFDPLGGIGYLDEQKRACLDQFLAGGTKEFSVSIHGKVTVAGRPYNVYTLLDQNATAYPFSNDFVEVIPDPEVVFLDTDAPYYFKTIIDDVMRSDADMIHMARRVYIDQKDKEKREKVITIAKKDEGQETMSAAVTTKKISHSRIDITLPASGPVPFMIKMNPLPGWQLTDPSGNKLPLLRGTHYYVGIGHGDMKLTYQKMSIMKRSYRISSLSFGLFLGIVMWRRRTNRA